MAAVVVPLPVLLTTPLLVILILLAILVSSVYPGVANDNPTVPIVCSGVELHSVVPNDQKLAVVYSDVWGGVTGMCLVVVAAVAFWGRSMQ